MSTRSISEKNKVTLVKKVHMNLKKEHGKKKYYKQEEVGKACRNSDIPVDWHCWAYCIFMDHGGFDSYHKSIGENCNYSEMRTSVVEAVDASDLEIPHLDTDIADSSWFDFFDGWFDFDFDIDIDFDL